MQVRSLAWEGPLEEDMAPHSSTLAWKSHRQRSLEGYSPCSCKESDTTERLALALCSFLSLESHIQFMSKSSWAFLYNPESYTSSPSKTKGPSLLTLSIPVRYTLLYLQTLLQIILFTDHFHKPT